MSKYKIIITLILFCFFQTTPSISFEIKIPKKLGDLKKITEDVKKELEKKEPEVKKKEIKKKEIKKKEVKKKEVKKEIVKADAIYFLSNCEDGRFPKGSGKFVKNGEFQKEWEDVNFYIDARTKNIVNYMFQNIKYFSWVPKDEQWVVQKYPMSEPKESGVYFGKVGNSGDLFFKANINTGLIEFEENGSLSVYLNCTPSIVDEVNLFTNSDETKKEKCNKLIASLADGKKSKILGGYKDFYFGMSKEDVEEFAYCKKELNNEILIGDFTQEMGKAKGYFIQNMYKYHTGVRLKDGKVNSIDLQFFVNLRNKTPYFGKTSEEFEQIKKVVLDKYELIAEPTKVSIDEFNKEEYGRLEWVLKSNIEGNLILLIYEQSPSKTKYFYTGRIDYLSSEESKIYKELSGSKKVKSDDL